MRWLRRLLLLALIVAVMVGGWRFASENQELVNVHYVAGELVNVPLWQVVLVPFGAGAGLVAIWFLLASARNGLVHRRYRKEIGGLEAEIHQLRNLPLAPESDSPGGRTPAGSLPTGGASSGNG
ncbi:MAG: lipopolysaccharide assembly protein LapA domain-containing protein [Myxococcota bacterium]